MRPRLSGSRMIVIAAATGVALAMTGANYSSCVSYCGLGSGPSAVCFGWPLYALDCVETWRSADSVHGPVTHGWDYVWHWPALVVDALVFVAITFSTMATCSRWSRRRLAPWQFSLREWFGALTATLVIIGLFQSRQAILQTRPFWLNLGLSPHWPVRLYDWYIVLPVPFGIGCAVLTAIHLVGSFAAIGCRRWTCRKEAT